MLADVSVNKFRSNLREHVERVIDTHMPLRVTRRDATDFVVVSIEDWEREQETLYILQNHDLMKKIRSAREADTRGERGYTPTQKELDALFDI